MPGLSWDDIEIPVAGRMLSASELRADATARITVPVGLLMIEGKAA